MKKFLFILLGLAVLGIAGLIAMCQYTGNKLKPLVNDIMVECDAGNYQAAYDRATDKLKAEKSLEHFKAYMELRKQAFGAYKSVGSIKGFSANRGTASGNTTSVTVSLEFEKATVDGKFDFLEVGGEDKWTAIQIDIPEANVPHADPADLVKAAEEHIQLFADGKLVGLYERFTPELKEAWPADKFKGQLKPIRESLGAYQGATHVETTKSEQGQRVEMKAAFENRTIPVRINFFDRDGKWQALGFNIGGE